MQDSDTNKNDYIPDYYEDQNAGGFLARTRLSLEDIFLRWGVSMRLLLIIVGSLVLLILLAAYLEPMLTSSWTKRAQEQSNALVRHPEVVDIRVEGAPVVIRRTPTSSVAVAYIRNPNKSYGVAQLPYLWKAYKGDSEIASGSGSVYMLPEDDRYIVLPFNTSDITRVTLEISPHKDILVRSNTAQESYLAVSGKQFENTETGFKMSFTVTNESAFTLQSIDIAALARNPGGALRAAVSTMIGPLQPGQSQSIELVWPIPMPVDTIVDIRAATNLLDETNLTYRLPESSPALEEPGDE